jgi:HD-GYP domain-containing protein (c-di-GMP phosphodiesterase class II)
MEITGIVDLDNIILRYKREMEHIDNNENILKQIKNHVYHKIRPSGKTSYLLNGERGELIKYNSRRITLYQNKLYFTIKKYIINKNKKFICKQNLKYKKTIKYK